MPPVFESEENNHVEMWKREMKQQLGNDIVPNRDANGRDKDDQDTYAPAPLYDRLYTEKL